MKYIYKCVYVCMCETVRGTYAHKYIWCEWIVGVSGTDLRQRLGVSKYFYSSPSTHIDLYIQKWMLIN